jgi:LPS sulfotransferase NodH
MLQWPDTPDTESSYLVCGTPRSGTSLLCRLLAATGVAGRPEEYFWRGGSLLAAPRRP